jgi:hypothetical protein
MDRTTVTMTTVIRTTALGANAPAAFWDFTVVAVVVVVVVTTVEQVESAAVATFLT